MGEKGPSSQTVKEHQKGILDTGTFYSHFQENQGDDQIR